jgi:hypothetical protein
MSPNVHDIAARQLRLLTPNEAATLLRISPKTLEKWRADDEGPPWVTVGKRHIRYDPADLAIWLKTGRRLGDLVTADSAA